jgi:hypothetical protein
MWKSVCSICLGIDNDKGLSIASLDYREKWKFLILLDLSFFEIDHVCVTWMYSKYVSVLEQLIAPKLEECAQVMGNKLRAKICYCNSVLFCCRLEGDNAEYGWPQLERIVCSCFWTQGSLSRDSAICGVRMLAAIYFTNFFIAFSHTLPTIVKVHTETLISNNVYI